MFVDCCWWANTLTIFVRYWCRCKAQRIRWIDKNQVVPPWSFPWCDPTSCLLLPRIIESWHILLWNFMCLVWRLAWTHVLWTDFKRCSNSTSLVNNPANNKISMTILSFDYVKSVTTICYLFNFINCVSRNFRSLSRSKYKKFSKVSKNGFYENTACFRINFRN